MTTTILRTRLAGLALAITLGAGGALAQDTAGVPPQPDPATTDEALVQRLPGFANAVAEVDGVRLHYVIGGHGPLLILLPGWPENWWEFHKVMPALAAHYRVASVDFRGMGTSDKPAGGYDKKTMARDVAALIRRLDAGPAFVVGHDIGAQVAFAVAANHPDVTRKLVLIDVAHPDASLLTWPLLPAAGQLQDKVGDGSHAYLWWFAFHQVKDLPERLMAGGRARIEQDWFFHYLTADDRSIDALSRDVYARSYWTADAIRAGNAWYQAFPQDIADQAGYARLAMPVLGIAGPGYDWVKSRLATEATTFEMVKVPDSGHFIPEEQPQVLVDNLERFLR